MENVLKLAIFIGLVCCVFAKNPLKEVFSWKKVDFEYPDENARQRAIAEKEFIPENALPLGVERWKNKLFVTFPRWKQGTPATLTYIDLNSTEKSPKFKPYPSWEEHKIFQGQPQGKIVNVFRVHVDHCDRLWIHDQGVSSILDPGGKAIKGNSIYVYDLKTDKLIREYTIPRDQLSDITWMANIISETSSKDCSQAYAYVPDLGASQLIVYDFKNNESWKVMHHFFHFDPLKGDLNIDGLNFRWQDGIFGVALSAMHENGYSTLYFHPMISTREFSVSTEVLRNKTLHEGFRSESLIYHKFKHLGCRGPNTQSSGSSLDTKTGILFYTLLQKNAVGCYNTRNNKSYDASTNPMIAQDNVTMIFPNDLKVDKESTLWVLTDRLPRFMFDHLDYNDVNFRILSGSVEEIVKGTACEKSGSLVAMNSLLFVVITTLILRWH